MSRSWNRFQESNELSDITLLVENDRLHVSKTLLMLHSPVFYTMFSSNFIEKDLQEIPLPGKKYSAVVELLDQIYPARDDDVEVIKDETLSELLQLADEYDVKQVFSNSKHYIEKQLCNHRLGAIKLGTEKILLYLGLVEQYTRLNTLRWGFIDLASRVSASAVKKCVNYKTVPATATSDIFRLRLERLEKDPEIAGMLKKKDIH